ncbi:F-box domain-containing protein [Favolaschia claudopus]|uniref:F-box domain-containing protein n=1 Tax=Favolaschia claudopus TaxID=2862362 RepID=A0AAW0E4A6_9AGAR
MSDRLPDEIIAEILSPALKVPDLLFSDTSIESSFATAQVSLTSSALLVCKAWLRVATPFLYHYVVLRSKAQADSLKQTLRDNPDLGRFVKNLRVEGGFGQSMQAVLSKTPNIEHIVLSFHVTGSDSTTGLVKGLPLINPKRLTVIDETEFFLKNSNVLNLVDAVEKSLKKWKRLNQVNLPYTGFLPEAKNSLYTAIWSCPTLRIVTFPRYTGAFLPIFKQMSQNPSLRAIEIRPKSQLKRPRAMWLDRIERSVPLRPPPRPRFKNARLQTLIQWFDDSDETENQMVPAPSSNPSFRPFASTAQPIADKLWSRILFFAMLSLDVHPEDMQPSNLIRRKLNMKRRNVLLVSQTFLRLGTPYAYYFPVIATEEVFESFSSTIAANPELGGHIRHLDLRLAKTRDLLDTTKPQSASVSLHAVLPHLHNLTRLICTPGSRHHIDPSHTISWNDLETLAETVGSTLQEFTGLEITFDTDKVAHSIAIFDKFTALKKLSWKYYFSPDEAVFAPVPHVSISTALPALEQLELRSPEDMFSKFSLPSLHHVTVENERGYGKSSAWGESFLSAHGSKIQYLDIMTTTMDEASVFVLCPNLTTLGWRPGFGQTAYDLGLDILDKGFTHSSLSTLILHKYFFNGRNIAARNENTNKLFAAVDNALRYLPALRKISISWDKWPTTDAEIKKSVCVKWAKTFLERGIETMDEEGTKWVPRLGPSGKGSKKKAKK